MATNLPVREMVLYKHGVGFFVRQGEVEGQSAEFTFRHDEINDVLKSLAVFDQAGGQVLGIHYQTPMDTVDRFANTSINLGDYSSISHLIRDLRGREATLTFEAGDGSKVLIKGRIIGIEHDEQGINDKDKQQNAVVILGNDGQVQIYPFESLRSFKIEDGQSSHDLDYFLDTSMREDSRRSVHVRLSEGKHDLVVYYVAPSPTWRVSYRLVADSDDDGNTGKALLQGWGLFDNRLDEDLNDVRVTLVAGQPISFIYDLYASRIPQRPTVQDESRIAPGPIEFAGGVMEEAEMDMMMDAPLQAGFLESAPMDRGKMRRAISASAPAPRMQKEAMAQSTTVQSEGKESGEVFQYNVTTPVSVKRGESALVPIIGSEISYERELLYNGAKLPNHPVASLRFENTTGLTLERGPVTVVEDGDYKGEAVVPFTKDNNSVYLPYAVELGVKVRESTKNNNITTGMTIEKSLAVFQMYHQQITTYTIDNTTNQDKTVTIEAPSRKDWELYETREPDVKTLDEIRWHVNVPAKQTAEFNRRERNLFHQTSKLQNLGYKQLREYLQKRWLDQSTYNALSEMLEKLAQIQELEKNKNGFQSEIQGLYEKQEQQRKNLETLQSQGQEALLRNRILEQLEKSQDRLEAIDKSIADAEARIKQLNQEVEEIIAGLNSDS